MKVYQDIDLIRYIEEDCAINPTWKERDFVSYTRKYMNSSRHEILAIGGLRGTGKTTGLLQAIKSLDAAYVIAQKGENETGQDYITFLKETDKKYIVIDEYSWISDRKDLDFFLYTMVQNGKRIAITGTESITLDFLNYGNLIHRIDMVHVNLFTYDEYCRLNNKEPSKEACREYLTIGGLFKEYAITNYSSMKNYIKTAIIDNLVGYMDGKITEDKATALVYAVLFKAICPSNLKSIPTLKNNKVTIENFLDEMGVNSQITFSEWELKNIADILKQIEVIVEIANYDKNSDKKYQYYITNPSLTCQLILSTYKITDISNEILGHVFEAVAICHLNYHLYSGHSLYFLDTTLATGENKELDAVITSENEDYVYFFECKLREDASISHNATLLDSRLQDIFPDSIIDGRYVVYNGDLAYRKFTDSDVIFSSINETLNNYCYFEQNITNIHGTLQEASTKLSTLSKKR